MFSFLMYLGLYCAFAFKKQCVFLFLFMEMYLRLYSIFIFFSVYSNKNLSVYKCNELDPLILLSYLDIHVSCCSYLLALFISLYLFTRLFISLPIYIYIELHVLYIFTCLMPLPLY
jgi:hypothetical protein